MMRLTIAETRRLWSRRMTRLFPAILAVLFVAGVVIAYFVIENDEGNTPDFVIDIAGGIDATEILGPIATLLPIMAFVIGASFIGADLKTGMLEQILTWEPRRLRLLLARSIAGFTGAAVLAAALATFLVGLLYGLAAAAGTTDGTTGEFWANVASAVVRTGVAGGLFLLFGLGITLLVNNSVGSIVGFVIYWFIVENFLLSVFLPQVSVYLPITNAASFASGSDVERIDGNVFGDFEVISHHGYAAAGLILTGWTIASIAGAAIVFTRRDIA